MHIPWQTALGAVFLSGVIFLALTAGGIRQMILRSIPHELYAAVASGIGLFIAFIGFRNAGLVIGDPDTLVGLGNIRNPGTALALFGLILMVALEVKKVRGSILIGVLGTTAFAWAFALAALHAGSLSLTLSKTTIDWAQNLVQWSPAPGGFRAVDSNGPETRHPWSPQQGPARDYFCLLLRRPLSTTSAPSWPSPSAPASSPPTTPSPASTASFLPTPHPPSLAPSPAHPPSPVTSKSRPASWSMESLRGC